MDHGAVVDVEWRDNPKANLQGAVGAWREAFVRMPYNREQLTPRGIISDTFETSTTWDRILHPATPSTSWCGRRTRAPEGRVRTGRRTATPRPP